MTYDANDCFNGSKDRYNWKLLGKKEIIVPYNNYKLNIWLKPVNFTISRLRSSGR